MQKSSNSKSNLRQKSLDGFIKISRMCIDISNSITPREREILSLLSLGLNSKEISEKLFLSPHTVDYHRRQLLKKTNSKNIAQLIGTAYHLGILKPSEHL